MPKKDLQKTIRKHFNLNELYDIFGDGNPERALEELGITEQKLHAIRARVLEKVLAETGYDTQKTARKLGVGEPTVKRWIERYGILFPEPAAKGTSRLYTGTYSGLIDSKGRMVIPQPLRNPEFYLLGRNGAETAGHCNGEPGYEFALEPRAVLAEKLSQLDNESRRIVAAHAYPVTPDSQGRIRVPRKVREELDINGKYPVVLAGAGDHIDVWNAEELPDYLR